LLSATQSYQIRPKTPKYSRNIAGRLAKHYILERFGGRTARTCGAYLEALIEGIAFGVEPVNKEIVSRILAFKLRPSNRNTSLSRLRGRDLG
jgi:hypothetical protein